MVRRNVGTAMADRGPKSVMPKGTVDGVTPMVVHGMGHIGDVISSTTHPFWMLLAINAETTGVGGGGLFTGGHNDGVDRFAPFPGDQPLGRNVNL